MAEEPLDIPEEAGEYLESLEAEKEAAIIAGEEKQNRDELHTHCLEFIKSSESWRSSSWETKWEKYLRMADSKIEPDAREGKEPWQSISTFTTISTTTCST